MGELIRFPVERRRSPVLGNAVSASSPDGMVQVTLTSGDHLGGLIFSNGMEMERAPQWWARVPLVTWDAKDRAMWMKLGLAPTTRAKRHRVIAIKPDDAAGEPVLMALAACGRRAPLTHLFDDAWSGGDCAACRKKGWR